MYRFSRFIEPDTEIVGGPELFIDRGSTINLTCVVRHSPEPPAYIFWNHNDAVSSLSTNSNKCLISYIIYMYVSYCLFHFKLFCN